MISRPWWFGLSLQMGFGVALGVVLSRSGFSDWTQVHGMFHFTEFRLLIAFATAVAFLALGWRWLSARGNVLSPRPVHPGSIIGGVLFGVGWAISGACPSIALVQLGEGKGLALCTLAGILIGNYIYAVVHERWFKWGSGSCALD